MVKPDLLPLYYHAKDHRRQYAFLGVHEINGHEYIAKNRGDGRLYIEADVNGEVSGTFHVDNMTANELEEQILLLFAQLE